LSDLGLEELLFLKSVEGQHLLSGLAASQITADNHLQIASKLRQQVGVKNAGAALETALLRQRGAAKFSRAADMYFTRAALEQASAEVVSTYRADRIASAGFQHVADLGCGIGGDSISLAARAKVIGVDWDPVRVAMAQENVHAYGRGERFRPLQADLLTLSPLPVEALFADPGRRDESGRRIYSLNQYRPPITFLAPWREKVPHQVIKIGPGVDYAEIPVEAEIEFISVKGEVREGVLWFGDLRSGSGRRATLLPGRHTLTDGSEEDRTVSVPKAFLFEPDGAVIRAHLVTHLAYKLAANKIDPNIAYLTAEKSQQTPFARCYAIDDMMPFQLKRLRQYCRDRNIGRVTIKTRGSPLDPDALRTRLRLRGDRECTIFLTQVMGKPTVLIGRPVDDK
jgi:hypothetical protein